MTRSQNNADIREQVEHTLSALIGLPLLYVKRAANMPTLGFGDWHDGIHLRKGPYRVATWSLHVQCSFRIDGPEGIVAGSHDMYHAAGDDPFAQEDVDRWDWERDGNRYDERTTALMSNGVTLTVESVVADEIGGFRMQMSDRYAINVFPVDSLPEEHWRFFGNGEDAEHFVVTGKGIGDEDD